MVRHKWRPQMTDSERRRGWVFFALYLLVFPYLNAWAQRLLMGEGEAPVAEANVVYYALLFALALLVLDPVYLPRPWLAEENLVGWLPENAFAFVTGLAGAGLLHFLVTLIPYPVQNPSEMQYLQEFAISPVATAVLLVVLIPLIEETLFRGLVFGSLRQFLRFIIEERAEDD